MPSIRWARRPGPENIHRLLTVGEVMTSYGITDRRLYHLVALGKVHPVKPNGRTLYPEWELEAALTGRYLGPFDTGESRFEYRRGAYAAA